MPKNLKDANLTVTRALPNGAAAVTSASIDLGHTTNGEVPGDVEFLITAPAMATALMGDGKTMIYAVVSSANADLSSPTVVYDRVLVQTGAGGAGCAAGSARFRLPSNAQRYVGVRATGSATGDATGSSFTLEALF
jgi:hypothetical protein